MAVWAYECRPCAAGGEWWVARTTVDAMPADVNVLRVKVGADWRCAGVDRERPVEVEAQLLRVAIASDLQECPDCAPQAWRPAAGEVEAPATATPELQAAAISIAGQRVLVVLVPLDLVLSPGEAEMLIADLRNRFGGSNVVLMGQQEDGSPRYHGEAELVALLTDVPLESMPWKAYPIA